MLDNNLSGEGNGDPGRKLKGASGGDRCAPGVECDGAGDEIDAVLSGVKDGDLAGVPGGVKDGGVPGGVNDGERESGYDGELADENEGDFGGSYTSDVW